MGQKDLPLEAGRYHVKIFEYLRWSVVRSKKNHFVLTHPDHPNVLLSIPDHPEVARGTLAAELRKCGISHEEYVGACGAYNTEGSRTYKSTAEHFCPNCGPTVELVQTAKTLECPDCQRAYTPQPQTDGSTMLVPII